MNDICLSGGAEGSDVEWGDAATANGHKVIHYSFVAHKFDPRAKDNIHVLSSKQLLEADRHLEEAAHKLRRNIIPALRGNTYIANLLRRNWWQVKDTERVYAISTFDHKNLVEGGTAWAVQMFIDRHGGEDCQCYVYEQNLQGWYYLQGWYSWVENNKPAWVAISSPPPPHGRWTGIGARDLLPSGKAAIRRLMGITNA